MRRGSGVGSSVMRGTPIPPDRARKARRRRVSTRTKTPTPMTSSRPPAAGRSTGRAARRRRSRGPGQQRRVRAVAREVLAQRELQAGEADEREAAAQQGAAAPAVGQHAADDERHREQDDQLGEREGRPRRLGGVGHAGARAAAPRAAAVDARPRAAAPARSSRASVSDGPCQEAKGQPEDSLTCHQPISMPMSPRRGRTCHTPQPPSPRSRLATRTNL